MEEIQYVRNPDGGSLRIEQAFKDPLKKTQRMKKNLKRRENNSKLKVSLIFRKRTKNIGPNTVCNGYTRLFFVTSLGTSGEEKAS